MAKRSKLKVIDFFCGAGGFSEGFRQQGFDIVMGIDNWLPAIETHNLNHNLNDTPRDVLDFESVDEINRLPDTEVIVGSPPCVLFSLSNKGGNADKTLGIRLIESFLRVVAVKKHQKSSRLVAWFMENVPNSKNYVKEQYTFRDLDLAKWAKENGLDPNDVALDISSNGRILDTSEFGASQKRQRFVCGEIVSSGNFPNVEEFSKGFSSVGEIKKRMPSPKMRSSKKMFTDPNYPSLGLKLNDITDHFYDTGIYESQWAHAKDAKVNHPYMGKMSFPEDESKPSRTIMATRSMTTREALIYKSEYERIGDGEYRLPTIREAATLMGFPYVYQFSGAENTKWRQIGNAVCPQMSSALAKSVRKSLKLKPVPESKITFKSVQDFGCEINNLNTFSEAKFDRPPKKKRNARFRRHPFKAGNMTVALTNFNPEDKSEADHESSVWYSAVFLGSGKDFVLKVLPKNDFKKIAKLIAKHNKKLSVSFTERFEDEFGHVIGQTHIFQDAYVDSSPKHNPSLIVRSIGDFIGDFVIEDEYVCVPEIVPEKERVPTKQVLAMYAINRLVS